MNILYFDCLGGISGDMMLGSLLDTGFSFSSLKDAVDKLGIKNISLKKRTVEKRHIRAVKFDVCGNEHMRVGSLKKIYNLISKSKLSERTKNNAIKVYETLASAEKKVHGLKSDDIEFEQLGEVDSLIDIIGTCLAFEELNIGSFFVSDLPRSKYMAPATVELLKGKNLNFTEVDFETVTPTGAAVLKAFNFKHPEKDLGGFRLNRVGYGAGSCDSKKISNVLRTEIFQEIRQLDTDTVVVVQSNVDDMSPEAYEYLMQRLFDNTGVLDVYFQPIQMKKSRPGTLITVLCLESSFNAVSDIIFSETSSLGIRHYKVNRKKLLRRTENVKTKYGKINIKIGSTNGEILSVSPEYEDCLAIAKKRRLPLKVVYDEAKKEGLQKWPYRD